MRFVVFVKLTGQAAQDYENGRMPTQDEIAQMMAYNEELAKAGVMVGGDGLHPTAKAVRIEAATGGKPKVTDGPFAESKELIGGFAIMRVPSLDEAVELAKQAMQVEAMWRDEPIEFEVRELYG